MSSATIFEAKIGFRQFQGVPEHVGSAFPNISGVV